MTTSKVSWADEALNFLTWNCSKVSEGCKNCYALTRSRKFDGGPSAGGDFLKHPPAIREKAFAEVQKLRGPFIFVNDHSDTFHEAVPLRDIQRMFQAMATRPDCLFLVLTKRPKRARDMAALIQWPANVWLGTSVERRKYLSRLDDLLAIPAAGHFLSAEPLLEPLFGLVPYLHATPDRAALKWVIVGGESDPAGNYRPFDKRWATLIQMVCKNASVPFFFKQASGLYADSDYLLDGAEVRERPQVKLAAPLMQKGLI